MEGDGAEVGITGNVESADKQEEEMKKAPAIPTPRLLLQILGQLFLVFGSLQKCILEARK